MREGVVQEGVVRADVYALLALMCFRLHGSRQGLMMRVGWCCMSSRTVAGGTGS